MKEKVFNFIKRFYSAVLIIVACFVLDFVTKRIVSEKMYQESITVIKGFFNLTYCENTGAAWSMFSGNMTMFIIISIVAACIFLYYLKYYDMKKYPFLSLGIAMMFGGMLGNFFDRVTKGYVVDFLDFNIFGYDYPVFNVADICLVIGVISLLVHLFVSVKIEKKREEALKNQNKENIEVQAEEVSSTSNEQEENIDTIDTTVSDNNNQIEDESDKVYDNEDNK